MDAVLVVLIMVALLGLYILPSLYAAYRQTSMMVVILVLNLLLGWTVIGWLAALALAVLLPPDSRRQPAPTAAPSDQASTGISRSTRPPDFVIDPMRVAACSLIGPVWYQYWWFYRFFQFTSRERFPRSRSFLWIFVPFYCYVVIGRLLHDLDTRLGAGRPANFQPQTALALIVAADVSGGLALRFGLLPFLVGGLVLSCVFSAMAFYQAQSAVNAYVRSTYPGVADAGVFPGEAIAVVASLAMLGLLVLGGTPPSDSSAPGRQGVALVTPGAQPTVSAMPSGMPTTPATPPVSGAFLTMASEAGDYIGQGKSLTVSQPGWKFKVSQVIGVESIRVHAESGQVPDFHWWDLEFAAPKGQQLRPGTYANAQRAAFRADGAAGIDVGGEGRGCNQIYGSFTVTTLRLDRQGDVQAVAVSFEQHCEGPSAPALRGNVRFGDPSTSQTAAGLASRAWSALG
jgi:hypothetical protein